MIRLKRWQLIILATPIAAIIAFLLFAAGRQIHEWEINWIWAIFTLVLVGWRWLLVKWTQPALQPMETLVAEVNQELESSIENSTSTPSINQAETALKEILETARNDPPFWEDWSLFWKRCQEVVVTVAHIYHPEVKYPLLNIYIPQAYGLIRGTSDDMDRWMQKLSPALNQVTVGQAYQAYETYQKLEPSARKVLQAWNWAQWLLNPAAALARQASQRSSDQAGQQLIVNLGQLVREAALRNLSRQAIALYSGTLPSIEITVSTPTPPKEKTQTLREILTQAEPVETVAQKPVNILLVGRTGAGKSSLINSLFKTDQAEVDVLPSTDRIQAYHWQSENVEALNLLDTPGYEQVNRPELREEVLEYATNADLLLLVTPALDPALQMDVDFLKEMKEEIANLPAITIVTQVDRLRPFREWEPPYDWQRGERPKEKAIREATQYRSQLLGEFCNQVLPVVTANQENQRAAWGFDVLSVALMNAIPSAKQLRIARFLQNQQARTIAAAKIIDDYSFQMATTQGLASLLKSPILKFLSTLTTGSPTLAFVLAEQISVEQLPVVIGKLQMAYELFSLFNAGEPNARNFDLLALWPFVLENPTPPERNASAFGHALVEYWTQNLTPEQFRQRFQFYFQS